MEKRSKVWSIISWLFGAAVFVDGILNMFWGNDFGLGVAFLLLSFLYFPPVHTFTKNKIGLTIPLIAMLVLGIAIIWITGAVGALAEGYIF